MSKQRETTLKGKAGRPEVARLFHALSDETRLAILGRLRNGEQCVCNLVDLLSTSQSRLSFHMRTLKDAGLVRDRREGRWIHYSLNPGAFETVHDFAASYRGARMPETAACCRE